MEQAMNPNDSNENEKLLILIDKMLKENPGTNFDRCFPQHFAVFHRYVDSAKKERIGCFPDRETYQAFSSAKLFFDKFKFAVFQKEDETQNIENEDLMPSITAFHSTEDEIEMRKNRFLESLMYGDVLHLKVVEEKAEVYQLQILNKYGDRQRIIDCSLFASLFKNDTVKAIKPPLKVDDHIRAIAFGNIKQEQDEKEKRLIVSLNSNAITDYSLKSLDLGRVCKKDIPYYPEDISKFKSFGDYLKSNGKFQKPEEVLKQICSFGCDPLKTGPLYETRYKKQIPKDFDTVLSEATQKLSITGDKTRKAAELLKNGDLLNAFLEIENVLELHPDNDMALTIRGKIYLALAGCKRSRKLKKAFIDFEAALRMNMFNVEAEELRDAILMISRDRCIKRNMPEKAKEIQDQIKKRSLSEKTEVFLKNIKKRKASQKKSSFGTGASTFESIPVLSLKEEPMDV